MAGFLGKEGKNAAVEEMLDAMSIKDDRAKSKPIGLHQALLASPRKVRAVTSTPDSQPRRAKKRLYDEDQSPPVESSPSKSSCLNAAAGGLETSEARATPPTVNTMEPAGNASDLIPKNFSRVAKREHPGDIMDPNYLKRSKLSLEHRRNVMR